MYTCVHTNVCIPAHGRMHLEFEIHMGGPAAAAAAATNNRSERIGADASDETRGASWEAVVGRLEIGRAPQSHRRVEAGCGFARPPAARGRGRAGKEIFGTVAAARKDFTLQPSRGATRTEMLATQGNINQTVCIGEPTKLHGRSAFRGLCAGRESGTRVTPPIAVASKGPRIRHLRSLNSVQVDIVQQPSPTLSLCPI